jgi:hypothetical protein
MNKKLFISLSTFALAIALGATSYRVNLPKTTIISGTQLKPGDYKVELSGNKLILKNGKTTVDAEVIVENGAATFNQTTTCCLAEDGKYRLQELRIGGTNLKVLVKDSGTASAGH